MSDETETEVRRRILAEEIETSERLTPPPINVGDPLVQRALDRLWLRVETERAERTTEIKAVRTRCHELANTIAVINEEAAVHQAEDIARHQAIDLAMNDRRKEHGEMKTMSEASAAAGRGQWWRILGVAVPLLVVVITGWVALDRRVTTVEARLDAIREKQDSAERQLDRIDGRLDIISDRLGVRPTSTTPP